MVGIVRRPDPEACKACAAGEWDMCPNGKYTEHGIKCLDGFARVSCTGQRAFFDPHVAVVIGAGPVGLLAALLGIQQGLEVHVFDVVKDGPKPELARDQGATCAKDAITCLTGVSGTGKQTGVDMGRSTARKC